MRTTPSPTFNNHYRKGEHITVYLPFILMKLKHTVLEQCLFKQITRISLVGLLGAVQDKICAATKNTVLTRWNNLFYKRIGCSHNETLGCLFNF